MPRKHPVLNSDHVAINLTEFRMEHINAHDMAVTIVQATQLFIEIKLRDRKPSTHAWYAKKFRDFCTYIGPQTPVQSISEIHLDLYLSSLYDPRPFWINNPLAQHPVATYKPTTIKNHCTALQVLFRWLRKKRYIDRNPADSLEPPRLKQQTVDCIPHPHLQALMDHFKAIQNRRNLSIVSLLANTGIRAGGFASIGRTDIDLTGRSVRVIEKRDRTRILPIDNQTTKLLADYASVRPPHNADAFFISQHNGRTYRMTEQGLRQMLRTACKRLKIPNYTPHQFRHRFATDAVHRGAGELWLQLMLGHEIGSPATKRYIHSDVERLRPEYDRLFQGDPPKTKSS